jgi:hypothetical protein
MKTEFRTIQISHDEIEIIKRALDASYNIGVNAINGMRELKISEKTITEYIAEINKFSYTELVFNGERDVKNVAY